MSNLETSTLIPDTHAHPHIQSCIIQYTVDNVALMHLFTEAF